MGEKGLATPIQPPAQPQVAASTDSSEWAKAVQEYGRMETPREVADPQAVPGMPEFEYVKVQIRSGPDNEGHATGWAEGWALRHEVSANRRVPEYKYWYWSGGQWVEGEGMYPAGGEEVMNAAQTMPPPPDVKPYIDTQVPQPELPPLESESPSTRLEEM